MSDRVEAVARAIYMTHWVAADPAKGRTGAPVWENVSGNVRKWVLTQARAAVAASDEYLAKAGMVIVPTEPTDEMVEEGAPDYTISGGSASIVAAQYRAMVKVAPKEPI